MLFYVKVRIDLSQLAVLGQKLATGALDRAPIRCTYCVRDDLAVGMSIWEAVDPEDFEHKFAPHRDFYAEVMEIIPVVTADESQRLLMAQLAGQ